MPKIILIRGVSGAGKSTYAQQHYPDLKCCEADQFWNDSNPFDPKLLSQAHRFCLNNTMNELQHGRDVVVANTFTQMWEMQNYLMIEDVDIEVIELYTQFQNIHNVPQETVNRMKDRWEYIDWQAIRIKCTKVY